MSFVGRRRTRDSVDSRIRPRVSTTLSQLFSKARRISVEPPRPITSDGASFHQWLVQYTKDPVTTSPSPSFEIRRPSGLGPRSNSYASASSLGSIHRAVLVDVGYTRPGHHRRRSASEPNLPLFLEDQQDTQPVTPSLASHILESQTSSMCETRSDSVSMLHTPSCTHSNPIPSQVWENVTRFLPHPDLSSLARVSSDILPHARKAIYENIDIECLLPYATLLCIGSLASSPELALLVRTFKSPTLPSFNHQHGPLQSLSFAFALCNMKNLISLSLPRFDNNLLLYTTFRLQRLSLSCETMSVLEQEQFFGWLATQRDMAFLSLPVLTTDLNLLPCIPVQRSSNCSGPRRISFHTPPSRSLGVPNLRKFDGPISLVQEFIPSRPVSEVVIHVNKTLYDGLKPSQLMGFIAKSTASIERLSIYSCPSAIIDARTMERLLMSAGAKFGPSVQHLEVGWATDDEVRSSLHALRNILSIQHELLDFIPEHAVHNSQVLEPADTEVCPNIDFIPGGLFCHCRPGSFDKSCDAAPLFVHVSSKKPSRDSACTPTSLFSTA
jgi:hypothetical protein